MMHVKHVQNGLHIVAGLVILALAGPRTQEFHNTLKPMKNRAGIQAYISDLRGSCDHFETSVIFHRHIYVCRLNDDCFDGKYALPVRHNLAYIRVHEAHSLFCLNTLQCYTSSSARLSHKRCIRVTLPRDDVSAA